MTKIEQALRHVQKFHPEVTHVFYSREGRWLYCDDAFNAQIGAEALRTMLSAIDLEEECA